MTAADVQAAAPLLVLLAVSLSALLVTAYGVRHLVRVAGALLTGGLACAVLAGAFFAGAGCAEGQMDETCSQPNYADCPSVGESGELGP